MNESYLGELYLRHFELFGFCTFVSFWRIVFNQYDFNFTILFSVTVKFTVLCTLYSVLIQERKRIGVTPKRLLEPLATICKAKKMSRCIITGTVSVI